jgi:hypothetical protein
LIGRNGKRAWLVVAAISLVAVVLGIAISVAKVGGGRKAGFGIWVGQVNGRSPAEGPAASGAEDRAAKVRSDKEQAANDQAVKDLADKISDATLPEAPASGSSGSTGGGSHPGAAEIPPIKRRPGVTDPITLPALPAPVPSAISPPQSDPGCTGPDCPVSSDPAQPGGVMPPRQGVPSEPGSGGSNYQISKSPINSFDECARAGYPIMESYPEQCRTPDGRNFTRP